MTMNSLVAVFDVAFVCSLIGMGVAVALLIHYILNRLYNNVWWQDPTDHEDWEEIRPPCEEKEDD